RGRGHQVITAVAVARAEASRLPPRERPPTGRGDSGRWTGKGGPAAGQIGVISRVAVSTVWMRDYGDDEIDAYIASGDPFDKAGCTEVNASSHALATLCPGCSDRKRLGLNGQQ